MELFLSMEKGVVPRGNISLNYYLNSGDGRAFGAITLVEKIFLNAWNSVYVLLFCLENAIELSSVEHKLSVKSIYALQKIDYLANDNADKI